MTDFYGIKQEESGTNPATIIVGSFILLIIALIVYLYLSNKALMERGLHKNKKFGKKSKKGKEVWSYGD